LLVKLIIFHKNQGIEIQSCQFRKGRICIKKIRTNNEYLSNRSVEINQNGLKMVREFGLKSEEIFRTFEENVVITKSINFRNINNLIDLEKCWIIETQYESVLCFPNSKRIMLKRGINKVDKRRIGLKSDMLTPIIIKIYVKEFSLFIAENTEASYVYKVVSAWMGQEPNSIKIQVCKIGQAKEGMGHIIMRRTICVKEFIILNYSWQ
jgi:hypothetical protein